jgi:hypothetical protein
MNISGNAANYEPISTSWTHHRCNVRMRGRTPDAVAATRIGASIRVANLLPSFAVAVSINEQFRNYSDLLEDGLTPAHPWQV